MIIWGLDLNRIRFSAFKHSRMFDPRYYLRSQRFIIYQLAMIFTVVGECMATYTLDKSALPLCSVLRRELISAFPLTGISSFRTLSRLTSPALRYSTMTSSALPVSPSSLGFTPLPYSYVTLLLPPHSMLTRHAPQGHHVLLPPLLAHTNGDDYVVPN